MSHILAHTPVTNFPSHYPWYKRLGSNITYWISMIPLPWWKNKLSKRDIKTMGKILQSGDIILAGNFRHVSSVFIEGIVTHAMVHLGKGKCIHADAHGVSFISRRKISRVYDTAIVLRPRWNFPDQADDFLENIISKIWKPYDFFFGMHNDPGESYFCTALVNDSLREVEYDTYLDSLKDPENNIDTALEDLFCAHRALRPEGMLYGNFDTVFVSHNLIKKVGKYIFNEFLE